MPMMALLLTVSLNLTCDRGKRLRTGPLRVGHDRPPGCAEATAVSPCLPFRLPPDHGEHAVQLVSLHKNVTSLRTLARSDDVPGLHEVHEPARLREAHAQLALEHGRRPELGG